jgi:hypothetical protein
LLTQHLNILPDWDMFQTVHDYSGFHAAARCVSGGPIYITDVPGRHDMDLIAQMTGMTPRGNTAIFRPNVLGKSIDQYVDYHDDVLLKVGGYHGKTTAHSIFSALADHSTGMAVTGTSFLGVFNISSKPLIEIIPLSRFPGVLPSMHYVARAHRSGRVTKPVQIDSPASLLSVSLDVRGYDIFSVYPVTIFMTDKGEKINVSNLGLMGKMTGGAAIISSSVTLLENGRLFLDTRLKALGKLGKCPVNKPAHGAMT